MKHLTADSEQQAVALIAAKHPSAYRVEAYDALTGWNVYVYATERAWGQADAENPGSTACANYFVQAAD